LPPGRELRLGHHAYLLLVRASTAELAINDTKMNDARMTHDSHDMLLLTPADSPDTVHLTPPIVNDTITEFAQI
jgi:hypothetical protein